MDNMIGTSTTNTLTGTSGDNLLIGKAGDDFIDGGDGSDIILAGAGNDTIVYDEMDKKIDGGTGLDTLLFRGTNQSLNFTQKLSVTNVEQIWLEGGGGHHLWFTAADIIRVSDNDRLVIRGDNTDHITLGDLSGWTFPTQVNANGSITFTNGTASFTARPGMQIDGYSQAATITLFPSEPLSVQEDTDPTPDGHLSLIFSAVISDPNPGESVLSLASDSTNLGSLSLISKVSTSLGIRYKYQYTVLNDDVQYLNTGDSAIDKFHLTSLDGTTTDVSISIAGQNENHLPTFVNAPGALDIYGVPSTAEILANTITRHGTMVVLDYDFSDIISVTSSWSKFSLQEPVHFSSAFWAINWTLSINDDDLQRAPVFDATSETITVTAADNHGGTSTWNIAYNLRGDLSGTGITDKFIGSAGNDVMSVGANQWGFGDDGNDTLTGTAASALVVGGQGDDSLSGTGTLFGDEGDDEFILTSALSTGGKAYGGDGWDYFLFKNTANFQAFGNAGNDEFDIDTGNTNLWLKGGEGSDIFNLLQLPSSSDPAVWVLDFDFNPVPGAGDSIILSNPTITHSLPSMINLTLIHAPAGDSSVPPGVSDYYELWMSPDSFAEADSPKYHLLNLVASDGATSHTAGDIFGQIKFGTPHA